MLVLLREIGESIIITPPNGERIRIVRVDRRRIGIEASSDTVVMREELLQDKTQETQGK